MPEEKRGKEAVKEPRSNRECPNCRGGNVRQVFTKGIATVWMTCADCGSRWLRA